MFHKACESDVMVDISKMFRFLSRAILGKSYLLARRGVSTVENEVIDTTFYCPQCQKQVLENEIVVRCYECGKQITLDKAYKSSSNSYVYCDVHQEPGSKSLLSLVKKVSIKTS